MSIDTFVDEGIAFTERHRNEPGFVQSVGGLTWGFMRALAECPDCGKGVYRRPVGPDGDRWALLRCPQCQRVWRWLTEEEAAARQPVAKPRKRK
ncbi:MAG: hypothetical protein V2A73_11855 [Pseudomonadota bacterium]